MVDSLELMSNVVSRKASKEISIKDLSLHESNESVNNNVVDEVQPIPLHLEQHPPCQLYAKMTAEDWDTIKKFKEMCEQKSERNSSVSFDEKPGASKGSRRSSSILKKSLVDIKTEATSETDAIKMVDEKCREALSKLNMEEVFNMLCDDNKEC